MPDPTTATAASQRGWRTPLLVLVCATLTIVVATGTRNTFGLFLRPVTETFGWGREVFAFAIALQNLMWGFTQPAVGMLADRYGAGRVLSVGGVVYALGLYLMAQVTTPLGLTLTAGLLIPIGLSAGGFAIVFGAVSRVASEKHRSLYMGIAASGGSVGQFIMLPLGQGLIATQGWSDALVTLGLIVLVMPALAVVLAGRPDKPQVGVAANPVQAVREAGRQGRYWLLFWGFFVCGFHVAFIATHLPAFLVDNAIAPAVAALALSLIGLFNIFGSLTLSGLGGRFSKRKLLCGIYLARAVAIALFVTLPLSTVTVLGFAAVMGSLWLATVPLTSGLVGQMYGVRYLSTLFSIVFLGHQLGSFSGVWLGGRVYDLTGSYTIVWWIAVGLGIFSAVLHWPIDERSPAERGMAPLAAEPVPEDGTA